MNPIDVSVIIPTFHREKHLIEAIESVRRQHEILLEIIVVDDSPKGTARSVVESINDPRIQYILRDKPSGGCPARVRNEGALLSRGRYLYFLDDDDRLENGTLGVLSKALDKNPKAGLAFGVITPFGKNLEEQKRHHFYFRNARMTALRLKNSAQLSANLVFGQAVLNSSSCMVRRKVFFDISGFDVNIPLCEDGEFYSRVAQVSDYVFIDRPVVQYRIGEPSLLNNVTSDNEKMRISYQIIQRKYKEANGTLWYLLMKFWTRVILR